MNNSHVYIFEVLSCVFAVMCYGQNNESLQQFVLIRIHAALCRHTQANLLFTGNQSACIYAHTDRQSQMHHRFHDDSIYHAYTRPPLPDIDTSSHICWAGRHRCDMPRQKYLPSIASIMCHLGKDPMFRSFIIG